MADILIRGVEMPEHCIDCPLMVDRYDTDACALQSQEANEAFESWDDMRRGCPLVPLPEGHGRLIDADALEDNAITYYATPIGEVGGVALVLRVSDVDAAETVIEAEGGGEDG